MCTQAWELSVEIDGLWCELRVFTEKIVKHVEPVGRYSIKVAYSRGVTVRAGGNFTALTGAWQMSWLSQRWAGR